MPTYQYRCNNCGSYDEITVSIDEYEQNHQLYRLCSCGKVKSRIFSFTAKSMFREHFNHSLGQPVETRRGFNNAIGEINREYEQRGIPSHFEAIDPHELSHTVTNDGMDATHRQEVIDGKVEVKQWL